MRLPQRSENPNGWLAFWVSFWSVVVWVFLLALTGMCDDAAGWGQARSISIGAADPFDVSGQPAVFFAVLLAITGWLLIPVLVGSAVALILENQIRKSRPHTKADVEQLIAEIKLRLPDPSPPTAPGDDSTHG